MRAKTSNGMRRKNMKKRFLSLLLCAVMLCVFIPQEIAAASALAGDGMCEHHEEHTGDCGYSEGVEGSPCTHEHTEDCYILETNCVHSHDETCYPDETVSDNNTAPSEADEAEPMECTHVCSEESGCITKMLNCIHEHDENCGYAEAAEGTPCAYDCPICSGSELDSVDDADADTQVLADDTDADAQVLADDIDADAQVLADDTNVDAQVLDSDTVAVIQKSDGTYAQYTTLQEAVQAVPSNDEATIQIVKDITITELIDIENRKIELAATEAHTLTFNIPADTANRNCFRVAGYSNPSSLTIGENLTVTTTNDSLRSIVNVGGQQGSFFLEGGTLSSGSADLAKAIVCVDNGGTMSMTGGTIQGNKNHNSRGVFLQDTSADGWKMVFTMTGGTITDCFTSDKGGGILMYGNAKFIMNGGTITNCAAGHLGGGVAVYGTAAFTMDGGTIESCSSSSGEYVYTDKGASFTQNGGSVGSVEKDGVAWIGDKPYLSLKAAIAAVAKNQDDTTTIKIVKDMTITEQIDIENKKIRLEADEAHTITFAVPTGSNGFRIIGGSRPSSLTIGENVTVTTTNDSLRSIVNVGGQQGSFSLEGGTLSSGSADLAKAIVCVDNGGTMFMTSGTIRGNKSHNSKGVFLQDTSADGWKMAFTMTGGTITDCFTSDKGGGIGMIGKAEFTMNGGTITNCVAGYLGGGVEINETAVFTMNGGEISSCTAAAQGGGVSAQKEAVFTLKGGKISGCKVERDGAAGGGICLKGTNVTFTMSGGEVCDNTAEYLGGGIYTESDATITAGVIQNNKTTCATGYGGGIYAHKEATVRLTNVVVTGNTARALGGGIWSCRTGDIKIYIKDGGAVFDNDAVNGDVKTVNEAGDDIASTVTFPAAGYLLISHHMLGGGANRYYVDGGVTYFSTEGLDHHHNEGPGLGAPDGKTARYDAAASTLVTETYITDAIALKNVVSESARTAANKEAKLIITGNSASRGGGIGTNGNLIIGTPDPDSETGNLTVEKEVAGNNQEADKEFSIQVTLKRNDGTASDMNGEYGEMTFRNGIAIVALKAGQSITATGLSTGISYMVEETAESREGYTVTYTNQMGTIGKDDTVIATVINTKDTPPKPTPETGSLTVSKTVSGNRASRTKAFTFTVTLDDQTISGTYGNMIFENGVAVFTLKSGESKTASDLPAGTGYTVEESDNKGYTITVNGAAGTKATGVITANTTAAAAFNNYKAGGGSTDHDPDPTPEPTPGRPVDGTPPTGDNSNISLWIALACFSLFSLAVSLFRRKRR